MRLTGLMLAFAALAVVLALVPPAATQPPAASPGSAMWIARPVGISAVWSGASSTGASRQARRSSPALPGVA